MKDDGDTTREEEEAWKMMEKEAEREKREKIWIGEFEFMDMKAIGAPEFYGKVCIVHRLHEIKYGTLHDVDNEQLDWIMPSSYQGEIVFSQGFMRDLGGNIKRFEEAV